MFLLRMILLLCLTVTLYNANAITYTVIKDGIYEGAGKWRDTLQNLVNLNQQNIHSSNFNDPNNPNVSLHKNWKISSLDFTVVPMPGVPNVFAIAGQLINIQHTALPPDKNPPHTNPGSLLTSCLVGFPAMPDGQGGYIPVNDWCKNKSSMTVDHEGHKDIYEFKSSIDAQGNVTFEWKGEHVCPPDKDQSLNGTQSNIQSCYIEPPGLVYLDSFKTTYTENKIHITWLTATEVDNLGFRLWQAIDKGNNNITIASTEEVGHSLKLVVPESDENCSTKIEGQLNNSRQNHNPLISAIGSSRESTCYSFTDTSNLSGGTYYYLLEDVDDDGNSTFHCDHIDAVTVGQGPTIDLQSAINYCKKITGSDN